MRELGSEKESSVRPPPPPPHTHWCKSRFQVPAKHMTLLHSRQYFTVNKKGSRLEAHM